MLGEDDEDVKNLIDSVQSESLLQQQSETHTTIDISPEVIMTGVCSSRQPLAIVVNVIEATSSFVENSLCERSKQ